MSLFKKKPLSKNLCLSFTGKESIFNNISLYNNFPIGLMIISKVDPISCRVNPDNLPDIKFLEEQEAEIKLQYINEHARDLFELKDNEAPSRIREQLNKFKLSEKNKNFKNNSDDNLNYIIFHQKENEEFFGSFKNKEMFIWVKFIIIKDDIYVSADYFTDERKQIQNKLFQSIKFQYIATLFHELYNPINAILCMLEPNKLEDELRNNLEYQNFDNTSDIDESDFSLITENELDKINYNLNIEEENSNNNNNNEGLQNDIKLNENYNVLQKKYQKCKKLEEYYRNKHDSMKKKEKDVRLLVNIIYIFLENLILYLRLNLGEGKDNLNSNFNMNNNQRNCFSENNSQKSDEENKEIKTFTKNNIKSNNKSVGKLKSKSICEIITNNFKNEITSQLYQDNYFNTSKAGQKINLEILFRKHLKKFSYLFKYKNIQYFNDFSFLSNKYIYTYEPIFSDFLGQIYSFLYYVVPKFHGFVIAFNSVSDNKMKLTFQKANRRIKTGYTHKKFSKKDSFILLGNKFQASNTIKTTEMTIELIHKLANILGLNVKIMDYEEQTEEKYLTILMPFYLGKDINKNENIHENEANLDSFDGKLLLEKTIKNLENISMNNLKNKNLEIIRDNTNKIIENINAKIITNNSNLCNSSKKVSFYVDDKDLNTSNKDNNINNNINSVNINININKNININNNFNSSSISSLISNNNSNINNKNIILKSINENNIPSPKNKIINNFNENNNNINKIDKGKNILTLIHEKYSFLERLKKNGVEILSEKVDKNNEKEFEYNNNITYERDKSEKNNEQNSLNAEADSENYFEIENDNCVEKFDMSNDDDASEEIIFNNNYNNINLQIGDEYWNILSHNKNNVNFNGNSPTNFSSNSVRKSRKEKINSILKQKKKHISNKNLLSKYYNKTRSYSKSPKDMLFVIPEIAENDKKMRPVPHPSCKLNNKYVNQFTECDCNDILLVDDDEFICKTFKNILKKFKLKADCAENGKDCLKKIKEKMQKNCKCEKNKYKIIFMDINMPIMDGIEAAKNIQKMIDNKEIYDNIKIIFISAHANLDLSTTISGIKCAVDYYAKPIGADKYKQLLDQYYYKS